MVYLTRRYRFSASHRLHSDRLSAEENSALFGKCSNRHGHGHNYGLEVTVAGPIDPATGMVYDLAALDGLVEKEIIERFDHTHLNLDVDNFRGRVPTTENLCLEIFHLLRGPLERNGGGHKARLKRVRLAETANNFFEYDDEREDSRSRRKVGPIL